MLWTTGFHTIIKKQQLMGYFNTRVYKGRILEWCNSKRTASSKKRQCSIKTINQIKTVFNWIRPRNLLGKWWMTFLWLGENSFSMIDLCYRIRVMITKYAPEYAMGLLKEFAHWEIIIGRTSPHLMIEKEGGQVLVLR